MPVASDSEAQLTKFVNCRLIRAHQLISDHLWIRGGRIIDPEPCFFEEKRKADVTIDCRGLIISPGFIDLQINGKSALCVCVFMSGYVVACGPQPS